MPDRVTLKEALARLAERGDAVSKSTLSRYLDQHAEAIPAERKGRDRFVDFDILASHRAENIRLEDRAPRAAAPQRAAKPRTQAESAARKITAEAEIKELQLAREKGLLAPVGEAQKVAREAVTQMRAAFDLAINAAAEQIAARHGGEARLVRPLLKDMVRAGLEEFARAMMNIAGGAEEGATH